MTKILQGARQFSLTVNHDLVRSAVAPRAAGVVAMTRGVVAMARGSAYESWIRDFPLFFTVRPE